MLAFGTVTVRLLFFGSVIGRLCWPLAQLLGDYVGLRHRYCEIVFLAQLLGDYVGPWRRYCEIVVFDSVIGRLCLPLALLL